jgi:hypothetical protein
MEVDAHESATVDIDTRNTRIRQSISSPDIRVPNNSHNGAKWVPLEIIALLRENRNCFRT